MVKRNRPSQPHSRNVAALILFGRSAVVTLSIISGALGFYAGIQASSADYDPHAFALGAAALFAAACVVIAGLLMQRRSAKAARHELEMRIEELSDRNWELREAEVRARGIAPHVRTVTDSVLGEPVMVLEIVSRHASLLVVGSRGLSRLGSLLHGSTAAHLAAHARRPFDRRRP